MQVRTGYTAGFADGSQLVAGSQFIPRFYVDTAHMAVHGCQALAVVHDYGFAVKEVVPHSEHSARLRAR